MRLAILTYGVCAYVLFLATFAYCGGFILGVGVPKHIDTQSPEAVPFTSALLVNASLLGVFAVQHLIMARAWFKQKWTRVIPASAERSTFVLVTCLLLVATFWLWQPMPTALWDVASPAGRAVLYTLFGLGFFGVVLSTFLIDHFELFGLSQVVRQFRGRPHTEPAFQVRSLYRYSRHPLYLCFLIAFWAAPTMTVGHACFALLSTLFILVGVRFEERDLVRRHGEAYQGYRRTVPMILPALGRRAPITEPTAVQG